MEHFYKHLEETLIDVEFLDPAAPRQLMSRLRRLYSRVRLDEMELNILRGVLSRDPKMGKTGAQGSISERLYPTKLVGLIVDQFGRLLHTSPSLMREGKACD